MSGWQSGVPLPPRPADPDGVFVTHGISIGAAARDFAGWGESEVAGRVNNTAPATQEAVMSDPRISLTRLTPGEHRHGLAVVASKEPGRTRNGAPYLTIALRNRTGGATAKVWSGQVDQWATIEVGDVVGIDAAVKRGYNGGPPELDIRAVWRAAAGEADALRHELSPICPVPVEELEQRFDRLCSLLGSPGRALLDAVIDHAGREAYQTAPGSTRGHHAYLYGQWEHAIEVAEIAIGIAGRPAYRNLIDIDLVVVGALLHDLGKVWEYRWEGGSIGVAPLGRLLHHSAAGIVLVTEAVEAARDPLLTAGVAEAAIRHLQHVMQTHHGRPEWGAPIPPASLEALIVHHADDASAKLRSMADALAGGQPDSDGWVTGQEWPHRGRQLLLTRSGSGAGAGAPARPNGASAHGATRNGSTRTRANGTEAVRSDASRNASTGNGANGNGTSAHSAIDEPAAACEPPSAVVVPGDEQPSVLLELPVPFLAYTAYVVIHDLATAWSTRPPSRLTPDEVTGYALWLRDSLPEEIRQRIPPPPPVEWEGVR